MKTDDELVVEAREGRLSAFDDLMLRYQKLVCRVALNYVKDTQSALDVTQNVFVKVYGHLSAVTAEGMFKPWLLRITYHESINWLRRTRRHRGHDALEEHERPATGQDQEHATLDRERRRLLLEGLETLNPKSKLAMALRYSEGMRVREIAEVMECSEGVVKSLLFRGVRKIRARVAGSA